MENKKQIADCLYTARWALNNNKNQHAYEKVTEALEILGYITKKGEHDIERDDSPMPEDFIGFKEPTFVVVKGVSYKKHGNYRTPSGMFKGLVVHYTVSGRSASNAAGVVRYLASKNLGCMVMDEDGKIYIPEGFDVLKHWGSHAGTSAWEGDSGLSDEYAGMEICCWGRGSKVGPYRESKGEANIIAGKYQAYTEAQETSLINFILWALHNNPSFKIDLICGHDEARAAAGKKGDKQDPGASLSMTMPQFRAHLKSLKKA